MACGYFVSLSLFDDDSIDSMVKDVLVVRFCGSEGATILQDLVYHTSIDIGKLFQIMQIQFVS